jgi:hypothetical protein
MQGAQDAPKKIGLMPPEKTRVLSDQALIIWPGDTHSCDDARSPLVAADSGHSVTQWVSDLKAGDRGEAACLLRQRKLDVIRKRRMAEESP